MKWEFRALGRWTDPETVDRKSTGVFRASWDSTLELLANEAEQLGAGLVVIQLDVSQGNIRKDGTLSARAHVSHPGAVVSFESRHGPLRYATDQFEQQWTGSMPSWQANVRAIALALQALRAVDRYGVTRRGEQYRGWNAITGTSASSIFTTAGDAQKWMSGVGAEEGITGWTSWGDLYRQLAKRMHPDVEGGSRDLWERLDAAATLLGVRGNRA